jgi:hypothetical protein
MIEDMTTEELVNEFSRCAKWMEKHPDDMATADFMLDMRYEYHHRTGRNIQADATGEE